MADLLNALRETVDEPEAEADLISAHDIRVMLGVGPSYAIHSLGGFPKLVRRAECGRNGRPAFYRRSEVEQWYAERGRKRAERAARRAKAKCGRAARADTIPERAITKSPQALIDAPMIPERYDWASHLRRTIEPALDGIDIAPAVLDAERERDTPTAQLRERDRWSTLDTDIDARPDPRKLAQSEAVNRRLDALRDDGKPRAKREPVKITLAERVVDPELMMASIRAMRGLDNRGLSETTPPPARRGHKPQQFSLARPVDEVVQIGA